MDERVWVAPGVRQQQVAALRRAQDCARGRCSVSADQGFKFCAACHRVAHGERGMAAAGVRELLLELLVLGLERVDLLVVEGGEEGVA